MVREESGCSVQDIQPINLGTRHMFAHSFFIQTLAKKHGIIPADAMKKQKILVILNKSSEEEILKEFVRYNFFGFSRLNSFFMVQRSYHGISIENNVPIYDKSSPKRLHNHGQMVMQETMDKEIFVLDESGKKSPLTDGEFGAVLVKMDDKQSICIEDLEFLVSGIDVKSLAVALKLSEDGYRMAMDVVGNNPKNPQKGGMAAYDGVLGRDVMIESFQLKGIKNEEIRFLNKNFNHYMKPYESWKVLKEKGLNMPIDVKKDHVYYQPVQGDINFLVKTRFIQRKVLKPIKHWKSPGTTPLTINHMKMQDELPGFLSYMSSFR